MKRIESASSPQVLRVLNARRILEHAWVSPAFTASDVMAATGLTRSTVIGVCDELVGKGWLQELSDARAFGDYRKGRPARRYALRERAGVVVGVDAGYDRIAATVTDLRGRELGASEVGIPAETPQSVHRLADAAARRSLTRAMFDDALEASGVDPRIVLAVTVGVPAPVDAAGLSPDREFWQLMNPELGRLFVNDAPIVTVENDANLAAIAERSSPEGRGRDVDSYIAMIMGEGIGSGLMIDRRLVRGRRGGAGEMRFLDHVDDVHSANGPVLLARQWATEAIRAGGLPPGSALARIDPTRLAASDVARAAESGDAAASAILERLAQRLARICIVIGDLLDVDRIVVGGSSTRSLPWVIDRASVLIAESDDPTAPELVASALGREAVRAGAVEHALSLVRERALELHPAAREAVTERRRVS